MKEINEFEEINNDINVEEFKAEPGVSDATIFQKMKAGYDRARNIESKLYYLIEMKNNQHAREEAGQEFSNDEADQLDETEDKLKADLKKADIGTIIKVINKLEALKSEYSLEMNKDHEWLREMIPADDPQREQKANYLSASGTQAGNRLQTIAYIETGIISSLRDDSTFKFKLAQEKSLRLGMTCAEFAKEIGFTGEEMNRYITSHLKGKPDEKIKDVLARDAKREDYKLRVESGEIPVPEDKKEEILKNPEAYPQNTINEMDEPSPQALSFALATEFSSQWFAGKVREGLQKHARANKLTAKQKELIDKEANELNGEAKTKGIKEWTNIPAEGIDGVLKGGEGRKLRDNLKTIAMRGAINDTKASLSREKGYDQYIRLHSGYKASHQKKDVVKENFAKAIAANLLKEKKIKFDVNTIRTVAQSVKKMPEFNRLSENPLKLLNSMSDAHAIKTTQRDIINKTFGVEPNRVEEYIRKMGKLYENMSANGKMSTEYQALRTAIRSIANMDILLTTEQGRQQAAKTIVSMNANLLSASEQYMKGKKSVRGTTEGENRFNNTLDALGLLADYAPETKDQIIVSVNKINKVRKVKEGMKDFVKLESFNEGRAAEARAKRTNQAANKTSVKTNPQPKDTSARKK